MKETRPTAEHKHNKHNVTHMSWPFEDLFNHDWSIDFRSDHPMTPKSLLVSSLDLLPKLLTGNRRVELSSCGQNYPSVLNFFMINSTDIPDSTINSTIHLFLILPMFSEFNHAFPRSKSWDSLKTSSCFSCENAPARWKSSWFFLRVRIFGRWKSMSSSTENLRHRFVFKPFATPDLGSHPFFCRRARQPLSSAASSSTSPAAPWNHRGTHLKTAGLLWMGQRNPPVDRSVNRIQCRISRFIPWFNMIYGVSTIVVQDFATTQRNPNAATTCCAIQLWVCPCASTCATPPAVGSYHGSHQRIKYGWYVESHRWI